jgi:hypothetical protein
MRTGNDILAVCTATRSSDQLLCAGWVAGLAEGIKTMNIAGGRNVVCFPDQSTVGQYRDIILAYLRADPVNRHFASGVLGVSALMRAYPCRNSN